MYHQYSMCRLLIQYTSYWSWYTEGRSIWSCTQSVVWSQSAGNCRDNIHVFELHVNDISGGRRLGDSLCIIQPLVYEGLDTWLIECRLEWMVWSREKKEANFVGENDHFRLILRACGRLTSINVQYRDTRLIYVVRGCALTQGPWLTRHKIWRNYVIWGYYEYLSMCLWKPRRPFSASSVVILKEPFLLLSIPWLLSYLEELLFGSAWYGSEHTI